MARLCCFRPYHTLHAHAAISDNACAKADAQFAECLPNLPDCNKHHTVAEAYPCSAGSCQPAHPDAKKSARRRAGAMTMLAFMHVSRQAFLCATAASPLAGEVSTLAERMFCFQSYPAPLPSQLRLDKQTSRACSSLPESPCSLVELIWHQLKGNLQYALKCHSSLTLATYQV